MPRIDVLRLRRWLWVAFTVDDFGGYGNPRLGWSAAHAWDRCAAALHDTGGFE